MKYESYSVVVRHMTHKSHVKFISFNAAMLNGSLCRRQNLIYRPVQCAVAAGKN